jgi:hypothetical protein
MNLPIASVKAATPMAWHLMVESLADGQATPQPHPLDDVPSIDKDDPAFIEFMATLRADRELDDDNPAYTVNW